MFIDYAIASVGEDFDDVMLVIEHRQGRGPVKLVQSLPDIISWHCADGTRENLRSGSDLQPGKYARLAQEIQGLGLLVAEFADMTMKGEPVRVWLLGPEGEMQQPAQQGAEHG